MNRHERINNQNMFKKIDRKVLDKIFSEYKKDAIKDKKSAFKIKFSDEWVNEAASIETINSYEVPQPKSSFEDKYISYDLSKENAFPVPYKIEDKHCTINNVHIGSNVKKEAGEGQDLDYIQILDAA
ncbi:hypothetical protein FAM21835_02103 [Lentilactobacillus parabuchneri]|nr:MULTISPECIES: hypothetical protein [Lentilactobacillus]MCP9369187.1 hypothetical protein [Lentilactobacillus kefiri]ORN25125.1 hypothetical protein FAM21835_02103 [Lentilactobacillus parabuchneri]